MAGYLDLCEKALKAKSKSLVREVVGKLIDSDAFLRGHLHRFAIALAYVHGYLLSNFPTRVYRAGSYLVVFKDGAILEAKRGLVDVLSQALCCDSPNTVSVDSIAMLEAALIDYRASVDPLYDYFNPWRAPALIIGVEPESGKLFVAPLAAIFNLPLWLVMPDIRSAGRKLSEPYWGSNTIGGSGAESRPP